MKRVQFLAFAFAEFLSPFPKRLKCPGVNPLKDAHAALAAAVLASWSSISSGDSASWADYSTGRAANGFSAKKDLLAQLLALNQEVAANIARGSPVTAPGVPKNYPDAKKLVREDCIKPS